MELVLLNTDIKSPELFYLVEFASPLQPGFRNNIVPIKGVPELLRKYGHDQCYTSCFFFSDDIRKHGQANSPQGKGRFSVSGYKGKVAAAYLPIDIDSKDLARAQNTARRMARFMLKELGAGRESLLVYFSGSAGFHLMLDKRIFGRVGASENLHITFALLREALASRSQADRSTLDFSIKDKLRLWRVPRTLNRKSGLYKTQLTHEELFTLSPGQVRKKAERPQPLFQTDRAGLVPVGPVVQPNNKAESLYKKAVELTKKRTAGAIGTDLTPGNEPVSGTGDVFCEAEKRIASSNIPAGSRNNAALRLVVKLRRGGFSRNQAMDFILSWNDRMKIMLPVNEILSIVRSVYSRKFLYWYGCNDQILGEHCPYESRNECKEYRKYKRNDGTGGRKKDTRTSHNEADEKPGLKGKGK